MLTRTADGNVCDAHDGELAMFGQASRIRYLAGGAKAGGPGLKREESVSDGATGYTFGSL